MSDIGTLVLLIGDYHIPQRTAKVPDCFKELLATDKITKVLCTGNVCNKQTAQQLREIANEQCEIVKGDADFGVENLPETAVVEVGAFRVGLIHGHQCIPWSDKQALLQQANKLGVDILVSGHTHRHSIDEIGNKTLINPGSVTGACNADGEADIIASFCLLNCPNTSSDTLTVYTYEDGGAEAKVS